MQDPGDSTEVAISWKQNVLVVAQQTASSPELLSALTVRAERTPTTVHLIVPAPPLGGERETAARTLDLALAKFRTAGLDADGAVGNPDPFVAVTDAWDPRTYDEIVVSTLPIGTSKWLHAGLPERIERVTGAVVTHVVSARPSPEPATRPSPAGQRRSGLGPLSVLGWGRAMGP